MRSIKSCDGCVSVINLILGYARELRINVCNNIRNVFYSSLKFYLNNIKNLNEFKTYLYYTIINAHNINYS